MCVCMCVLACVRMHVSMFVCMWVCLCVCMYVCMRAHMCRYMHVCIYHTRVWVHACVHVYVYKYIDMPVPFVYSTEKALPPPTSPTPLLPPDYITRCILLYGRSSTIPVYRGDPQVVYNLYCQCMYHIQGFFTPLNFHEIHELVWTREIKFMKFCRNVIAILNFW